LVARKILFALTSLPFIPVQTAVGHAPNSQSPTGPDLTAQTSLVIVPALVRSKSGQLVFNLNASDFTLTDDGIPQKLTPEQDTGGEPLALVVVVEETAGLQLTPGKRRQTWKSHSRFPQPQTSGGE
jgi:hypothetical protein